ncbi:MAG: DUF2079 domain-containing protein [Caldilineales bacterium]
MPESPSGSSFQQGPGVGGAYHQARWAWPAVAVMAGAWAIALSWLSIQRHLAFKTSGDMALFAQAIWSTAHGRPFYVTLWGGEGNFLGHHFVPLLAALAPLYRLWPDARLLLVVQVLLLAVAVIPLYAFARPRLGAGSGLLIVAAYLLFPALAYAAFADFHEITLAVPLFMAAGVALLNDRLRAATIWLALALLLKEEVALIAVGFGLYAAFFLGHRRYGLTLAALSALWGLLVVFVLMPALGGGGDYQFFDRYATLGSTPADMLRTLLLRPGAIYQLVSAPHKLVFTWQLLFPLAFLPLAGTPAILLALPTYAYLMLSDYAFQTSITFYYAAPLIPFLMLATVTGLQRIRRWRMRGFHWALLALAAATLAAARLWSPLPFSLAYSADTFRVTDAQREARALLETIPPDASVVADGYYNPWLANRFRMGSMVGVQGEEVGPSRIPDYRAARRQEPYAVTPPEYPWIVRNEPGTPVVVHRYGMIQETAQGLVLSKWLGPENDVTMARYDMAFDLGLVLAAAGTPPEGPAWGPSIRMAPGATLPVWMAWQATEPIDRRVTFSLHLVDADGNLVAQSDGEMGGGQYPTTLWDRWSERPTVAGEFPVQLPADLPAGRYSLLAGAYDTETVSALSRPDGNQWVELASIEVGQ